MAIKSPPLTNGRSVERMFASYLNGEFVINRSYQRKLVWTTAEKQKLIKTLINGYPLPLIILAKRKGSGNLEILDGLQRLNAISSFVENDFDVDGKYFDCQTFTAIKTLADKGEITQKEGRLDAKACASIASYDLPMMTCEFENEEEIDEAFRLINSSGQRLSAQELRNAGSTSEIGSLVATIAQVIRRDDSPSNIVPLSKAKMISMGPVELGYGISEENEFWVKNFICNRKEFRRSRDEEIIADILGHMLLGNGAASNKDVRDGLYDTASDVYQKALRQLNVRGKDSVRIEYFHVHDDIRKLILVGGDNLCALIGAPSRNPIPRYFQSLFLALWKIRYNEGRELVDYKGAATALKDVYRIDVGRGEWTEKKRNSCISQVKGMLHEFSAEASSPHALTTNTAMFVERLITHSKFESNLFDFKQGFHDLRTKDFQPGTVHKCIKTLCAITNAGPKTRGHILVGVCDSIEDANQVRAVHGTEPSGFNGTWISGVQHEISLYAKADDYFRKVKQAIEDAPVSDRVKSEIAGSLTPVERFGKLIVVLSLQSGSAPEIYDGKYYQRVACNIDDIEPGDAMAALFSRFNMGAGAS